jgi:hypothetical protein
MPFLAAAPLIAAGIGGASSILGSWLSGRPKTTTQTTTPTWSPGQTDLLNQVQNYAKNQMNNTDPAFQQMKLNAQDQINRRYAMMPSQISRQMASRGYGSSGNFGNTMYQSDYQRSGEMSDLTSQIMQMIMNQRNQGASLSDQLLGLTRGSTTTGTSPDMSSSNALLSTGNAFSNIGTMLSLSNALKGMGTPGGGSGVSIPDVLGGAWNGAPAPYGSSSNPVQYWPGTNIPRP